MIIIDTYLTALQEVIVATGMLDAIASGPNKENVKSVSVWTEADVDKIGGKRAWMCQLSE